MGDWLKMAKELTKELKGSSWGIKVDKSKATRDYRREVELKTGRPCGLPFPEGSRLNEPYLRMIKINHEKYKAENK